MDMRPDHLDWREVLAPRGRWSALVTAGSSPARVRRQAVGLAYLAVPYATEVALRGVWRMERSVRLLTEASLEIARLAAQGVAVACPNAARAEICQAGPLAGVVLDPLDDPVWQQLADVQRHAACLLVVPALSGWDRCPAIRADVAWALAHNRPVHVYAEAAG